MNAAAASALGELVATVRADLVALAKAQSMEAAAELSTLADDAAAVGAAVIAGTTTPEQGKHDLDLLVAAAKSAGLAQAGELVQAQAALAMRWLGVALDVGLKIALA